MGIDVADPSRVSWLRQSRGELFTRKWFTTAELAECEREPDPDLSCAARLAAKEAVWKAIGISWRGAVPWLSIAILGPLGAVSAELSGAVAAEATATGIGSLKVSMSETEGLVMAIAIAFGPE